MQINDSLAIILSAGKGSRMESSKPKSLVNVFNRPILSWMIDDFHHYGIEVRPVINPNYKDALLNKGKILFMKGEYGYGLSIDSSNKLRFWSTGDRTISDAVVSDMSISLGNWHHIAVSSDGAVVKFYIDGKFAGNNRTDAAS